MDGKRSCQSVSQSWQYETNSFRILNILIDFKCDFTAKIYRITRCKDTRKSIIQIQRPKGRATMRLIFALTQHSFFLETISDGSCIQVTAQSSHIPSDRIPSPHEKHTIPRWLRWLSLWLTWNAAYCDTCVGRCVLRYRRRKRERKRQRNSYENNGLLTIAFYPLYKGGACIIKGFGRWWWTHTQTHKHNNRQMVGCFLFEWQIRLFGNHFLLKNLP